MREKRKRLYSLTDELEICWVDISTEGNRKKFTAHIYYDVLDASDGVTSFEFAESWINTTWFESVQDLMTQVMINFSNYIKQQNEKNT